MTSIKQYPDGCVTVGIRGLYTPDPLEPRAPWTQDRIKLFAERTIRPDEWEKQLSTMGLSNVPNSHKAVRSPKGRKGITPHGRRLVKFAAAEIERRVGQRNTVLITTTLPPAFDSLDRDVWVEACRQFLQMLHRAMLPHGYANLIVSVTEIQEARQAKCGGLPLHLHIVLPGRKPGHAWILTPAWVREHWRDAIRNATGNDQEIDFGTSTRIEQIRHSAASYLGKYMSKGCKATKVVLEQGLGALLPPSWYSCTRMLRSLYKSRIRATSGVEVTEIALWMIDALADCFSWSKWVEITAPSGIVHRVGWIGYLKSEWSGDRFWNLLTS